MKIRCPHCEQKIDAGEEWAGQEVPCPRCTKPFMIPELRQGTSAAARPNQPQVRIHVQKQSAAAVLAKTLLWLLVFAGAGFGYAMYHFKESPEQVWRRIESSGKQESVARQAPQPGATSTEAKPHAEVKPEPVVTPAPESTVAVAVAVAVAPEAKPEPQATSETLPEKKAADTTETAPEPPIAPAPEPAVAEATVEEKPAVDPITWLLARKNLWPATVTLSQPREFSILIGGQIVGATELPSGTKVQLVEVKSNSVLVRYGDDTKAVPIDETDLRKLAEAAVAKSEALQLAQSRAQSPLPPAAARRLVSNKPKTFVHPGLLHTEEDFKRMREKVRANKSPWIEGWQKLTSSRFAQLSIKPRAVETAVRGSVPGNNIALLYMDAAAAYQTAVRWKVSGEKDYAEKSVEILNAWGSKLKQVNGNADRFLAAGIYGYQLANAAEIMRTYNGWKPSDFKRFQDMMLEVFYPMNQSFLYGRNGGKDHNGAAITNYWANWDLCNIAAMQAIGVLCDRRDIYDEAMTYVRTGGGNGSLHKAVYYLHDGNLGQWQEAGRDQGHNTLGIALMGPIMEAAWNQGDDLYGEENNRFLAGAEHTAKYNLGHNVPFQTYAWGTGPKGNPREQTQISGGQGTFRLGYEIVINHYVNRMGIAAPYSEAFAARMRPEGGPGGHASTFDQVGFGTLTATRELEVANPAPSSLIARRRNGKPFLSWWGAAGAESYNVKRAANPAGPYTTIATGVKDILVYADETPPAGNCYYVVTGIRNGKETGPSNAVAISSSPALRFSLKFDEFSGTTAVDSVTGKTGGILPNKGSWETGKNGKAISLDGKDQYVELPTGVVGSLADFTISAWVNVEQAAKWSRLFDFGDARGQWMFLTVANNSGMPGFEVSTVYGYNSQRVNGSKPLPLKSWVHLAVTLSGKKATLYLDGEEIGSNPGFDFPPFQLGDTPQNWIGRSQTDRDPYLNGAVDDFRIYDGALTPEQLATLAKGRSSP
jgi:hypothetical protein